jgi:hypothetical protein
MLISSNYTDKFWLYSMALVLASPANATVYLSDNPVLTPANTLVIFQVFVAVDTVFDVCALNAHQKLALLCQGINTIPKLQLLGTKQDDLSNKLKPLTLLPLNCGGHEFTIDAVTSLTTLVLLYKDCKQFGQTPIQMHLDRLSLMNMLTR